MAVLMQGEMLNFLSNALLESDTRESWDISAMLRLTGQIWVLIGDGEMMGSSLNLF